MSKFIYVALLISVLFPLTTFANGGDQRVKDGYLVNLSRSPFTPVSGVKTSMLVSFVDLKTGLLIKEDIRVNVRIAEGRGSKTFIQEDKNLLVKGGVLEYKYTFQNSGMHEVFFDFTFANDPAQKVHELPDFLIDVQKPLAENAIATKSLILGIILGAVVGLLGGWLVGRRKV